MSETLVPILKETKDPFYRYKMPKIAIKVEGSGNGIKTVITNMAAIGKALNRPPSYPTKYFGCDLGAQVSINGDYVINGLHDQDKLMNSLYGFIRKFVLCPKCLNPETSLSVTSNRNATIEQKCLACGHKSVIPKNVHKLTTFILNNPPDGHQETRKTKSKKSSAKIAHPEKQTLSRVSSHKDEFDDEDDLLIAELDENSNQIASIDKSERVKMFTQLLIERKNSSQLLQASGQNDLYKEAERLMIKSKSALVLCEVLLSERALEEIKQYKSLLMRFCENNSKAQRYFLGGIEKLCGQTCKEKLLDKETIKIMKELYDEDIVDEATFLDWAAKPSKKYVTKEISKQIHDKCQPFIKWLREADTQSSASEQEKKPLEEEEEDEEDDILEFSHRVSGLRIEPLNKAQMAATSAHLDLEADDIDIDQI